MSVYYMLVGQTPVPVECDPYTPEGIAKLLEFGQWFETADRRVALTRVLDICEVSTVFLGMDHGFMRDGNAPVLFETMAFWPGESGYEQRRACTWAGAEKTHRYMVEEVSRPRAILAYVGRMWRQHWEDARGDLGSRWRELLPGTSDTPEPGVDAATPSKENA
jgi:hypothetical protein